MQPTSWLHSQTNNIPNTRVEFLYESKEDWAENKLGLESDNICAYTDGSANELGVGADVSVESTFEDQAILNSDQEQSVSLSKTTTIFQAEMLALSMALTILNSCVNTSIALITESMSVMQSLQNPAVRNKTKLSCINQVNSVAQSNQLALIWVPGHPGIHGNKKADEMANIGAALETMGPDPAPPISLRYIKGKICEWSVEEFHNKWSNSAKASTIKETLNLNI